MLVTCFTPKKLLTVFQDSATSHGQILVRRGAAVYYGMTQWSKQIDATCEKMTTITGSAQESSGSSL